MGLNTQNTLKVFPKLLINILIVYLAQILHILYVRNLIASPDAGLMNLDSGEIRISLTGGFYLYVHKKIQLNYFGE